MASTRSRVLALVLAGGEGGRLDVLTEHRAKPAMPYAGVYRLIDFPLSNCRNSGISDVWILQQYEPHSLTEHLANGRPWDLDRTHGGLRVLHPHVGRDETSWYRGNADAIHQHKAEIEEFDPDVLLVLSADHVYALDYGAVVDAHHAGGAAVTVVTTRVPPGDAGRFGTVEVDAGGRIVDFDYKPEEPESDVVTAEVFAYDAERLIATLDELADGRDDALSDFGDELLPRLVARGDAYEYRLDGYWKDVGTVESYWQAHMELLDEAPQLLADPEWPILTRGTQRPPARIDGAAVEGSLVAPGTTLRGTVIRSVLGPGVVVEDGATVRDSILLEDVVVAAGATVERAILDADVEVREDARVGESEGEIAVVGRAVEIEPGAPVAAGARIAPNELPSSVGG